jgi:probable F420-dependent oxidoreductase
MIFWLPVTWAETDQLVEIARVAEEVGFHGIINSDHAFFPGALHTRYPYSESGEPFQHALSEYPDCWVTIAAMAAVTSTLRFTSAVYVLPLRNPIEIAKAAATLDIVSGGRFALGVGTGWMKEEFDVYGVDFATRGPRTTEMVEVMQALWQGGMVAYHGQFFDFPELQIHPVPERPVPVYFGGSAPVALRRCATCGDGWLGAGNRLDEIPGLLRTLAELRRDAGRDHLPFEAVVPVLAEHRLETFRELEALGVGSTSALPFPMVLPERSSLDDKKRVMEAFATEVIRHFGTPG